MQGFQERQITFHHYLTSLTSWLCRISVIAKGHISYAASNFSILRGLGVQGRPRRVPFFILVHWLPFHIG